MILLNELKITNFISHSDTRIIFKNTDKILLDGKSGGGKTAIVESILWCLYGRGRSEGRSLIRKGCKNASVCLKLIDEEKETIITRSITDKGKSALAITQNTGTKGQFLPIERVGIKDLQDFIETDLLKASYELFTNSVAYPQDNQNSFVKATASRRKDLLLEIVHAGSFDDLYDKTRRALSVNETESAVAVSKIENLETAVKEAENIAGKYDFYKLEVDSISAQIETATMVEKDLETRITDSYSLTHQVTAKNQTKQAHEQTIVSIDRLLKRHEEEMTEHEKVDINGAREGVAQRDKLLVQIEGVEGEIKEGIQAQQHINAHLSNKPSVFDYSKDIETINKKLIPLIKDTGRCPSGDACPFVIPIQGQIAFLTEQIAEKEQKAVSEKIALEIWEKTYVSLVPVKDTEGLYAQLKGLKDRTNSLFPSIEIVKQYESFESFRGSRIEGTNDLNAEKNETLQKIIAVDIEIKQLEQVLSQLDLNKINAELASIRISLKELQGMKNDASVGMVLATNAQKTIKDVSVGLVELRRGVSMASEDKEALELLKEALSPRGVRAVIVDYITPELETRINEILSQMSDFRIRLDTQQAKADPEEGNKEGLWITIKNDIGQEMPFESYSGGERVKITIAISEALCSLQNSIGFRIMDENIVSLDKESTESFVEVLTKLQNKFPQLLIISHLSEIQDLFETKIKIIKVSGISKIIE